MNNTQELDWVPPPVKSSMPKIVLLSLSRYSFQQSSFPSLVHSLIEKSSFTLQGKAFLWIVRTYQVKFQCTGILSHPTSLQYMQRQYLALLSTHNDICSSKRQLNLLFFGLCFLFPLSELSGDFFHPGYFPPSPCCSR